MLISFSFARITIKMCDILSLVNSHLKLNPQAQTQQRTFISSGCTKMMICAAFFASYPVVSFGIVLAKQGACPLASRPQVKVLRFKCFSFDLGTTQWLLVTFTVGLVHKFMVMFSMQSGCSSTQKEILFSH